MTFLLREHLGFTTIRVIGDYLRMHGSGRHWIEKNRGQLLIHVCDPRDEAVLLSRYSDLVDPLPPTAITRVEANPVAEQ
jgi:hypothetical protein